MEQTLIRKYRPKYNFLLKDDKSFSALQITDHEWPALRLIRYREEERQGSLVFGPYTSSYAARSVLRLLEGIFPLRQCSDYVLKNRTEPCILYRIKRCIAPCANKCTREEYADYVSRLKAFLEGKDRTVIRELESAMQAASEKMEYEKADGYLQTIRRIQSLLEKQTVISGTDRDCDVISVYREGCDGVIGNMHFRRGKLTGSTNHPFSGEPGNDEEILSGFLLQQYYGRPIIPQEILVPVNGSSIQAAALLLNETSERKIVIRSPRKGEKRVLLESAYENAKGFFIGEAKKNLRKESLLLLLKEELELLNYPGRIECFDNSHFSGTSPVSVMVPFTEGNYERSGLRKYHLKNKEPFDDIKGMTEVLTRRCTDDKMALPDLILLDGGKGQLEAARKVLEKCGIIHVDLLALTKEKGRHDFGAAREKIYKPNRSDPILLDRHSPLLFFLQTIRDQAHRSVLSFQKKTARKKVFSSILDDIPGIGPRKKKDLLLAFKSPERIRKASREDLEKISSLSRKDIDTLLHFFLSRK